MKVLVGIFILLLGLGFYMVEKETVVRFQEEVLLAQGQVIELNREFRAKPLGEIGGPGGWEANFNSFSVTRAGNWEIPPVWNESKGYLPVLLDYDSSAKVWTVLVSFDMCEAFYSLGRPSPPYGQFVAKDGKWVRTGLSKKFIGRETNMLSVIAYRNELSRHTIASKRDRTHQSGIADNKKTIIPKNISAC